MKNGSHRGRARLVLALAAAVVLGACQSAEERATEPDPADAPVSEIALPETRPASVSETDALPVPDAAGPSSNPDSGAGAPGSESPVAADANPPAPIVATSTALDSPVPIESDGDIVHAATNMRFPREVAGFRLISGKRYDEEGHDVGISYTRTWRGTFASVTVYVYPRPVSREDGSQEGAVTHHAAVVEMLLGRWQESELIHERRCDGEWADAGVTLVVSEHEHGGSRETFGRHAREIAYVMSAKSWWVKVRVTTPSKSFDTVLPAVDELLVALDLPPTGPAAVSDE